MRDGNFEFWLGMILVLILIVNVFFNFIDDMERVILVTNAMTLLVGSSIMKNQAYGKKSQWQ